MDDILEKLVRQPMKRINTNTLSEKNEEDYILSYSAKVVTIQSLSIWTQGGQPSARNVPPGSLGLHTPETASR